MTYMVLIARNPSGNNLPEANVLVHAFMQSLSDPCLLFNHRGDTYVQIPRSVLPRELNCKEVAWKRGTPYVSENTSLHLWVTTDPRESFPLLADAFCVWLPGWKEANKTLEGLEERVIDPSLLNEAYTLIKNDSFGFFLDAHVPLEKIKKRGEIGYTVEFNSAVSEDTTEGLSLLSHALDRCCPKIVKPQASRSLCPHLERGRSEREIARVLGITYNP